MKGSKALSAVAALFLMVMILDSQVAISGAKEGLSLCLSTVIPSLFPFFVMSILLTAGLSGWTAERSAYLLMGFLGGYPVGAQAVSEGCAGGRLSRQDGEKMLAYCSNVGPAFLFGIGSSLFAQRWMCWLLWLIHIFAALLVAAMTPRKKTSATPAAATGRLSLTDAMGRAVRSMAMVCGWIVMFRTIIAFLRHWFLWLLPVNWQLLVTGLLEMTNGCCALAEIPSDGLRMQLFSLFLGFGGVCVVMQTQAVIAGSGLSGKFYFPGKAAQCAISYLLCLPAQFLLPAQERHFPALYFPLAALSVVAAYGFYWNRIKKDSSICVAIGV